MDFSDASFLPQHPQEVVWRLIYACTFFCGSMQTHSLIFLDPQYSWEHQYSSLIFVSAWEVEDTLGADLKLKV